VKAIKDIEHIYSSIILENEKVGHVEAPGDTKEAKEKAKNTGPESADGVEDPVTPENAGEDSHLYDKKISEDTKPKKKSDKNSGNLAKESINNCVMDSKNIFDKLYSTIMEDDGNLDELPLDAELGDDGDLELSDEEGLDEVTVSLPRDVAEQLLDLLGAAVGNGDEEEDLGDDLEGGDLEDGGELDFASTQMVEEGPYVQDIKEQPSGVEKLTGKNNKVGGKNTNAPDGGGASGDATGADDGSPKNDTSSVETLQSKNPKVNNPKSKGLMK
tara:strand:+ start:296 stop:1111 length:816 start_codon:yes stop_codon:yes gene_type:complete